MDARRRLIVNIPLCWMLLLSFAVLSVVTPGAEAALFENRFSDGSVAGGREAEIETIRLALEKDVVTQRLADYGLSPEEVSDRLDTLTDEQVHELAGLSGDIAGGSILEAIIAVLLIVLLVVLILKVSDKEIIIK